MYSVARERRHLQCAPARPTVLAAMIGRTYSEEKWLRDAAGDVDERRDEHRVGGELQVDERRGALGEPQQRPGTRR